MDDLPHLVVDEPKRSKKALAAITIVSLMIVLIPVGVYLATQRTQLTPQAATQSKPNLPETSLTLKSEGAAALGGEIAVDVYIRADSDNINLVNTKINFDPQALKVTKIATSSATNTYFATKWLESYFDNNKGQVSLIGGVPNPGVKTNLGDQSLKLATIYFRPQRLGPVSLSFQEGGEILRNSDNLNALQKTNKIDINISEGLSLESDNSKLASSSSSLTQLKPNPNLNLTTPKGGEVFSYFKPITLRWNSKDIDKIKTMSLYMNEQFFGEIAFNFTNNNHYDWSPQTTILLPYITPLNTYEVEITGTNKKGQEFTTRSQGPFGILVKEDIKFSTPSADLNGGNFGINDASLLLSQFGKELDQSKVDINKDGVVNQLDLWLLRQYFTINNIIR